MLSVGLCGRLDDLDGLSRDVWWRLTVEHVYGVDPSVLRWYGVRGELRHVQDPELW